MGQAVAVRPRNGLSHEAAQNIGELECYEGRQVEQRENLLAHGYILRVERAECTFSQLYRAAFIEKHLRIINQPVDGIHVWVAVGQALPHAYFGRRLGQVGFLQVVGVVQNQVERIAAGPNMVAGKILVDIDKTAMV